MKFYTMKKAFLLLSIFYFTLTSSLSAQSFKVLPARLDFKLEKGGSESRVLDVINTSDVMESFVISTCDFTYDDKGNTIFAKAGSTDRSCAKWMTVTPNFIKLNPNEKVQVHILLNVPQEIEKTLWGMVTIRSEKEFTAQAADKDVLRAGMIITPQIAVRVLQTPPALDYKKLAIDNFYEITNTESDTVRSFAVNVANQGDVMTKCKLYLTLSNLETLVEKTVEPLDLYLFPEISKEVKIALPKDIEPGYYSVAAILDYGDEYDLEGMEMEISVSPKN